VGRRGGGASPIRAQIRLDATTTSPREARRFVADTLSRWGDHGLVEAAALLVSELVTNAVVHARSNVDVIVDRSTNRAVLLRVEVHDGSAQRPVPGMFDLEALSGRGLALIEAMATRWGVEAHSTGKHVWFELEESETAGSSV
jgi:anti-sigma regulatory factor (Ser/Thr protein kinase)